VPTKKKPIKAVRDEFEVDLETVKFNENYVVMGMRAMTDGEENKGQSTSKYSVLAECNSHNRVIIQVFSFDESHGIQNIRKNRRFTVLGKINYYRSKQGSREFHSLYVEKILIKKRV
jgi:hypothetical protein